MHMKSTKLACGLALVLGGCTSAPAPDREAVSRGKVIYAKECAACHGPAGQGAGSESLGIGMPPPDLTRLTARNDGYFPREFVRRFVLGLLDKEADSPMPDFASVGLSHVYPDGGADGEVLEADFEDMLDYLESIQQ